MLSTLLTFDEKQRRRRNRIFNMKLSAETFKGTNFEIEANLTDANKPAASGASSTSRAPVSQGISNVGLSAGAGSLNILRNNQQFQAMRDMVQAFFRSLELHPMFENLGKQNPLLMGVILKHQSEFLRLINELVEGGKEMVSVTPEDVEAIKRLQAMGNFREGIVGEVYYRSDKDEKIAATFLHDHADEFLKRG